MSFAPISVAVAQIEHQAFSSIAAGLSANRAKDTAIKQGLASAPRPEIVVNASPEITPQAVTVQASPDINIQPAFKLEITTGAEKTAETRTYLPPTNITGNYTKPAIPKVNPVITSPWAKLPTVDAASKDKSKHTVKVTVQQVDIVSKGMLLDLFI